MDWMLFSLSFASELYSTLLWPVAMCNHSCVRQELAYYIVARGLASRAVQPRDRSSRR